MGNAPKSWEHRSELPSGARKACQDDTHVQRMLLLLDREVLGWVSLVSAVTGQKRQGREDWGPSSWQRPHGRRRGTGQLSEAPCGQASITSPKDNRHPAGGEGSARRAQDGMRQDSGGHTTWSIRKSDGPLMGRLLPPRPSGAAGPCSGRAPFCEQQQVQALRGNLAPNQIWRGSLGPTEAAHHGDHTWEGGRHTGSCSSQTDLGQELGPQTPPPIPCCVHLSTLPTA